MTTATDICNQCGGVPGDALKELLAQTPHEYDSDVLGGNEIYTFNDGSHLFERQAALWRVTPLDDTEAWFIMETSDALEARLLAAVSIGQTPQFEHYDGCVDSDTLRAISQLTPRAARAVLAEYYA